MTALAVTFIIKQALNNSTGYEKRYDIFLCRRKRTYLDFG